jgi:hypothetical protein
VAIERARKYPPGYGYSYIGKPITKEDVERAGFSADAAAPDEPVLAVPGLAVSWFASHPGDVEFG